MYKKGQVSVHYQYSDTLIYDKGEKFIMVGAEAMTENTPRYSGSYNRLFPMKISTNTFITIYTLHLLKNRGGLYGKEIINAIEERFQGDWKPSHGLVYPILRELEAEGLVVGKWEGEGSKKTIRVYKITEQGLLTYEKEKDRHEALFTQSFMLMETIMGDLYETEMIDFSKD